MVGHGAREELRILHLEPQAAVKERHWTSVECLNPQSTPQGNTSFSKVTHTLIRPYVLIVPLTSDQASSLGVYRGHSYSEHHMLHIKGN